MSVSFPPPDCQPQHPSVPDRAQLSALTNGAIYSPQPKTVADLLLTMVYLSSPVVRNRRAATQHIWIVYFALI